MASRDIANMHLFLDLKKKFPYLPDETLRSCISLFAEDKEKCINLLQKESENHYHPSQPFSDFRLPESKVNSMKNDYMQLVENPNEGSFTSINLQHLDMPTFNKKIPPGSGRSSSYAGVVQFPGKLLNPDMSSKPDSFSAPVITSSEKPFNNMYKQSSVSSHSSFKQTPSNQNNQIMFHTTKNHIIEEPMSHESTAYIPVSREPELSKKHAVKLSITPSFPFPQQHANVFNNPVCATSSQSSKPGRHTTSLNFQLQPQTSDQFPLEISTIPTNIGNSCNSRDFGSHVQISIGSQGATFTAVRLQRPSYTQAQNTFHLPVTEECPEECMPSSQVQNSNIFSFPNQRIQLSPKLGINQSLRYPYREQGFNKNSNVYASNQPNAPTGSFSSYPSSHDYILAVKNHQIAQLDLILSELEKEKFLCSQLRTEVNKMEQEVIQRNVATTSFSYAEELQKLREEVRNLSVEISCLSMEVDSAGQIPLGVTDEDFYANIFTGPNGALSHDISRSSMENKNQSSFEDDDDERNGWRCKNCTFANHPALEKCEICELPKNLGSFFDNK